MQLKSFEGNKVQDLIKFRTYLVSVWIKLQTQIRARSYKD